MLRPLSRRPFQERPRLWPGRTMRTTKPDFTSSAESRGKTLSLIAVSRPCRPTLPPSQRPSHREPTTTECRPSIAQPADCPATPTPSPFAFGKRDPGQPKPQILHRDKPETRATPQTPFPDLGIRIRGFGFWINFRERLICNRILLTPSNYLHDFQPVPSPNLPLCKFRRGNRLAIVLHYNTAGQEPLSCQELL